MELERQTRIAYLIVPKPGGGFIARPSDPAGEPLEAPTREELQQKIQAKVVAELGAQLSHLKLPFGNTKTSVDVLIDRKPETSVTFHSTGPKTQQELAALLQKNFPEVAEALAAQPGNAQAFGNLNRKEDVFVNLTSQKFSVAEGLRLTGPNQAVGTESGAGIDAPVPNSNIPISPESSGSWKILRFLVAALILLVLVYFFRHR